MRLLITSLFLAALLLSQVAFVPSVKAGSDATLEYVNSALWSGVNDVVSQGSYLFAAYQYGLQVIDITDPSAPTIAAQLYLPPGGFVGIAVQGDYVYLAAAMSGVAIVDIHDPLNPRLVSWCDTPGSVSALVANGSFLYASDSWEGVQVVNVADPEHPVIEGAYNTPGDARGVALYGEYVLIADGYDGGLQIVNVALPQVPYPAGSLNTDGIAKRVVVEGHYAYVADGDGAVVIVDISDPTQPVRKSIYPPNASGSAEDIAVSQGIVYFASGYLKVLDATDPENPHILDTLFEAGYCLRLVANSARLFSIYPSSGLTILDIQTPSAPVIVGRHQTLGDVRKIAASGSVVTVTGADGVHIFDASEPSRLAELSFISPLYGCEGVAVSGNYLYFTDADSGTHVIDISDPDHPAEVNRFWSTGNDYEVTVSPGYLCVSGNDAGTTFYRLDDPVHPSPLGSYGTSYFARAACNGHHGYIAARYSGFQVVNLIDSAAPFREGVLPSYGAVTDVALDSPYAYLAYEMDGLVIANIANPANPVEVSAFSGFPGTPRSTGIAYDNGLVFLTATEQGVWVIDVSNRRMPVPIAVYNTLGKATRIAVSGDNVYVADLFGVTVLRLTRPTGVGDDPAVSKPDEMLLARNYPNPFNPQTTIEFSVPRRAHVRLVIYNILGEEVAELANEELGSGTHSIAWDGRDSREKDVASGVYLYRLTAGGTTAAKKMLLLK